MEITSNYSLTKLFVCKQVKIFTDFGVIAINLKPLKAFYEDEQWATFYTIVTNEEKRRSLLPKTFHCDDAIKEIKTLIFEFGKFIQYDKVVSNIRQQLLLLIDDLSYNFNTKELEANGIIITSDIWNYIIYILKLSCGEKESKPLKFENEAARQLYLAQKQFEKQVNSIKNQNGGDSEQLLKILVTITYKFPSFTIDYLFNQTMAQIHWLYKYAAKSVSYEVTAQAYAAGNLKKGSTPDFFIK